MHIRTSTNRPLCSRWVAGARPRRRRQAVRWTDAGARRWLATTTFLATVAPPRQRARRDEAHHGAPGEPASKATTTQQPHHHPPLGRSMVALVAPSPSSSLVVGHSAFPDHAGWSAAALSARTERRSADARPLVARREPRRNHATETLHAPTRQTTRRLLLPLLRHVALLLAVVCASVE